MYLFFLFLHNKVEESSSLTCKGRKGMEGMARRGGVMSDRLKEEIAKELGFYDTVQREGWGGIRARDAGNMVKRAIQIAEEQIANKHQR